MLVGLMIVCMVAAVMSTADSFMVASAALGSRNLYAQIAPNASEKNKVLAGRVAGACVIALAILIALVYSSVLDLMKVLWTVLVAAGPVILMSFIWRRTNRLAAWAAMVYTLVVAIGVANMAEFLPPISGNPYCTATTEGRTVSVIARADQADVRAGRAEEVSQKFVKQLQEPGRPLFFERIEFENPDDIHSKRTGRGRFRASLIWLKAFGVPLEKYSFATLNSLGFAIDAIAPFVIIIIFSYIGKPGSKEMLDRFYARLHTPALADHEEDARQVKLSEENPHRFDDRKMFPNTQIELLKPTRAVWLGFLISVVVAVVVLGFLFGICALTWP